MEHGQKSYRIAYTIIERNERKRWVRIGAAFNNRDGSINVLLDAIPTNGTIQLRDWVPEEAHLDARKINASPSQLSAPSEASVHQGPRARPRAPQETDREIRAAG